ncbi:tyrosine-type recombinase/integrase [Natrialbaceae archaeon A-chndr2]
MTARPTQNQSQYGEGCPTEVDPGISISELKDGVDVYLQNLQQKAANTTYLSHQTALNEFINQCRTRANVDVSSIEKVVVQFIKKLLTTTPYSLSTISGYVCTLSNFIAYFNQHDPELVKANIVAEFDDDATPRLRSIKTNLFPRVVNDCGSNLTLKTRVEELISYLRQRQFGTRTHAFAEVLLDTKSRPGVVQQLNLSDLDFENNTLRMKILDTHLVGSTDLVTEFITRLDSRTVDALQAYTGHERTSVAHEDIDSLFTTSHGRASDSTFRRSIKQASEAVDTYSSPQSTYSKTQTSTPRPETQYESICPSDLWKYSISRVIE